MQHSVSLGVPRLNVRTAPDVTKLHETITQVSLKDDIIKSNAELESCYFAYLSSKRTSVMPT